MIDRRHAIQVLLTASLLGASWLARALPPARGKVILTVSGSIAERNAGEQAQLDLDMIESLPQRNFTAMTLWFVQAIRCCWWEFLDLARERASPRQDPARSGSGRSQGAASRR